MYLKLADNRPRDPKSDPFTPEELKYFASCTGKVSVRNRLKYRKMLADLGMPVLKIAAIEAPKVVIMTSDNESVEFRPLDDGTVVVTTRDHTTKRYGSTVATLPRVKALAKYNALKKAGYVRF